MRTRRGRNGRGGADERELDAHGLAAVGEDAIEGAITGRALYEGNFTLAQALAAARGEE